MTGASRNTTSASYSAAISIMSRVAFLNASPSRSPALARMQSASTSSKTSIKSLILSLYAPSLTEYGNTSLLFFMPFSTDRTNSNVSRGAFSVITLSALARYPPDNAAARYTVPSAP